MVKRLILVLALLALAASTSAADKPAPVVGKIFTVKADTLVVNAKFEAADWLKDGAKVKLDFATEKGGKGKGMIVAVQDSLITIVMPKAEELEVGTEVTVTKARMKMTGC